MYNGKKIKNREGKKYFVSISGGESSGHLIQWMEENKHPEDEVLYGFANTSKEREETLVFTDRLARHYNIEIVWIEAVMSYKYRGETTYRFTDFENACRNGEVFEEMIKDYGIPNQAYPHCTRELKTVPLQKLAHDILGEDFYTVIGIRVDEIDRVNKDWKELKYLYPHVINGVTKPEINSFWNAMPFRLELKGYEGNCGKCWKKTLNKLLTIEYEETITGIVDDWWSNMEDKYGYYVPDHRKEKRKPLEGKLTFYRNNLSAKDLRTLAKQPFKKSKDDSKEYSFQSSLFGVDFNVSTGLCSESCEPF